MSAIDALTTQVAAVKLTASTRQLALGAPADDDESVFISLDTTAEAVNQLVSAAELGTAVFIRAPVATGKSTLAAFLPKHFPLSYALVATTPFSEKFVQRQVILAVHPEADVSSHELRTEQFAAALKAARQRNLTLIFDEAHQLFGSTDLSASLFKNPNGPRVLLFSTAAHGGSDGASSVTPNEISEKYMWYPPLPDAPTLSASLKEADVFLKDDSVTFFLKLCGGHRGIFMRAMAWVKEQQQQQQQQQPQEQSDWNIAKSVTEVRASLARGGWDDGFRSAIAQSRAVRVNSKYSELHNIPAVFANLLAGGAKKASELKKDHRALTIAGFVVPQQRSADSGEFVKYDWIDSGVRYGVANSMMAQYYRDKFSSELNFQSQLIAGMDAPTSCADLLARALPFMSFVDVVSSPIKFENTNQSPLSAHDLPVEEHYNDAIVSTLKQLNFDARKPQSEKLGQVDVFVTVEHDVTFAIESIMATRSSKPHKEHVDRFVLKSFYIAATHKCLVTIGSNSSKVLQRVRETAADHGVDIIGLVVSQAHDSYTMYVKGANEADVVKGPLFFACDRVAKSLDSSLNIVSAQELKHIDKPQEEKQQQPAEKQQYQIEKEQTKAELKEAETKLEKAETKLEKAETKLEKAREGGDNEDIERAMQGAATAQIGVTSAQKMVTYLTDKITGM